MRRNEAGSADEEPPTPATSTELQFQTAARRYRRRLAVFVKVLLLGFGLAGVSLLAPEPFDQWVGIPGVACVFAAMFLYFTAPALTCPVCTRATDSRIDRYCPACGHTPLDTGAMLGTHCDGCGRTMGSYKHRNYPIRFCTHCGTFVDRHGV